MNFYVKNKQRPIWKGDFVDFRPYLTIMKFNQESDFLDIYLVISQKRNLNPCPNSNQFTILKKITTFQVMNGELFCLFISVYPYFFFLYKLEDIDFVKSVKLTTLVESDPKAPFSIATTPKCRGRALLLSLGCSTLPLIRNL